MRGQIVGDIKRNVPPAASAPNQSWACQHAWSLIQQLWTLDPRYRPSASSTATLLNYTARSIPLVVMRRIIFFSATINNKTGWGKDWIQRTRSLLTLSLVSGSVHACAIPFLYRDIRIFPIATTERLSNLVNTFNSSINSRHIMDDLSSGYGYYTRTFLVCFEKGLHSLPADLQHSLDKMTKLHTLVIRPKDDTYWQLPVDSLSSVLFQGFYLPLILDQGTLRVILPFQRLYVDRVSRSVPPIPGALQARQVTLLPNLREICIINNNYWWEATDYFPRLLHTFQDWAMPHLDSLECNFVLSDQHNSALNEFLWSHGRFLRYLKLTTRPLLNGGLVPQEPTSNELSLCSNLQSFLFDSTSPIDILSLDPHPKLEMLFITAGGWTQPYLERFEEFTSSWRTRFPNLRVATFQAVQFNWIVGDWSIWLEMRFCTEDSFYTVKIGKTTCRRWEGKWIGTGTLDISVENPADASPC